MDNNLLVCFPTKTVYALACSALDSGAIKKYTSLTKIAELEEKYFDLINYFSPAPITYMLPLKNNNILPNEFFKGSVRIRIPNHPIAISILNELKTPIVATSINISREINVYKANDIPQSIRQHLSAVVEDDKLVSGKESTVIDLTGDKIKVLREVAVSFQVICFQAGVYRRKNEKSNRQ
ncbi:Sua5/YciO/YrdC/YwlC family protein [Dictyocaulus viviparus]|uniref:Threonylcarbamoyl-AMP synthase n=1 Tax=Dictyocaulus viviparus TaxID=29172 RepID=A0A0D8XC22_DICVI|nr:Sua5/YciO/YrdC/YwlC family protein [Dictyocaulus viviparus]